MKKLIVRVVWVVWNWQLKSTVSICHFCVRLFDSHLRQFKKGLKTGHFVWILDAIQNLNQFGAKMSGFESLSMLNPDFLYGFGIMTWIKIQWPDTLLPFEYQTSQVFGFPHFYSGDLNSEHLDSRNIWILNFHLSAIQAMTQIPNKKFVIQAVTWITNHSRSKLFWTIWILN